MPEAQAYRQRAEIQSPQRGRRTMFACIRKDQWASIVRTIGIARARVKIGMANLAYNIRRFDLVEDKTRGCMTGKRASRRHK